MEICSFPINSNEGVLFQQSAIDEVVQRVCDKYAEASMLVIIEGAPSVSAQNIHNAILTSKKIPLGRLYFMKEIKRQGQEKLEIGVPKNSSIAIGYAKHMVNMIDNGFLRLSSDFVFYAPNTSRVLVNKTSEGLERVECMLRNYREEVTASGGVRYTSKMSDQNNDALSSLETACYWMNHFYTQPRYAPDRARIFAQK